MRVCVVCVFQISFTLTSFVPLSVSPTPLALPPSRVLYPSPSLVRSGNPPCVTAET